MAERIEYHTCNTCKTEKPVSHFPKKRYGRTISEQEEPTDRCIDCDAKIFAQQFFMSGDPELRYAWGRMPGFGRR